MWHNRGCVPEPFLCVISGEMRRMLTGYVLVCPCNWPLGDGVFYGVPAGFV